MIPCEDFALSNLHGPSHPHHRRQVLETFSAFEHGRLSKLSRPDVDEIRDLSPVIVIDLGPEGGKRGGEVVAQGTPEEVAGEGGSYTGRYLKRVL